MTTVWRGFESMTAFFIVWLVGMLILPFYLLHGAWSLANQIQTHGFVEGWRRWEP